VTSSMAESFEKRINGNREEMLNQVLRDAILERGLTPIQVDDNCARLLQMLTLLTAPLHAVEIGTYFGYSAIHIARGLPPKGRLTTIEKNAEFVDIARINIAAAGFTDTVDVVHGDAMVVMETFEPESLDLVFVDADKASYPTYLKLAFPRLRPGGVLAADDVFGTGNYSHESAWSNDVSEIEPGIRTYVLAASRSPLLFSTFVGTRYGLMISRKVQDYS
jgi:caffeoyl-CoA O-methyltransferase